MTQGSVTSEQFPYVPLYVSVERWHGDVLALLDTGFDGELVLPAELVTNGRPADLYQRWRLADGSEVQAPAYLGTARVGVTVLTPILVTALGTKPIAGVGLIRHFRVILDRGETVTIEL